MAADDTAFVRQLQQMLVREGFPIKVDGVMGPQTKAAMAAYEQRAKAPPPPRMRPPPADVMNASPRPPGMPVPNMRPPPDQLGTGSGLPMQALPPVQLPQGVLNQSPPQQAGASQQELLWQALMNGQVPPGQAR